VKTIRAWQLAVLLAPAVLIYALFSALPLLDTLRLGFYTANDAGVRSFVGLDNYRTILFDPDWSAAFWNAMWNNVKFFCIHMPCRIPSACCWPRCSASRACAGRAPTAR
jgi:raffinose/stachyose/melibiose transport system permease protein